MTYVLEKWNSTTESWDDISDKAEVLNPEIHLDILGVRQLEYNGKTMELDADSLTLVEDDYIRYRTDDAVSYYENIIKPINSEMSQASGHDWVFSGAIVGNINTTVALKMYLSIASAANGYAYINLPDLLKAGHRYKVVFNARHNAGTANEWRFGQYNGASGTYYGVTIDNEEESQFTGYFTPDTDGNFSIKPISSNNHAVEIDDIELYVEVDPVIFSGYVNNLVLNVRCNKYELDIINEVTHLKQLSIPRTLSGSNLRERLMDAMPDGYVLVEMDSNVATLLENTRGNGMQYINDEVIGADEGGSPPGPVNENRYTCILDHVSDSSNYPVTGANWADYWDLAEWEDGTSYSVGDKVGGSNGEIYNCILSHVSSSSTKPVTGGSYSTYWEVYYPVGPDWETNTKYESMHFSDLLHDTLLIVNSEYFTRDYLIYAVILNKEVRIYCHYLSGTPTAISDSDMHEIEKQIKTEYLDLLYFDLIKDDLRGVHYKDNGDYIHRASWITKSHKFYTIAEHNIMDHVSNSGVSGFITGIEKDGAMYTYDITNLSEV